jgi:hypothetical protein
VEVLTISEITTTTFLLLQEVNFYKLSDRHGDFSISAKAITGTFFSE